MPMFNKSETLLVCVSSLCILGIQHNKDNNSLKYKVFCSQNHCTGSAHINMQRRVNN